MVSSSYRSCGCHVRTCVTVIGVLESIFLLAQLIQVSVQYSRLPDWGGSAVITIDNRGIHYHDKTRNMVVGSFAAGLVGLLLAGAAILAMFVGAIWMEKRIFLIPHLVIQAIGMVAMAIGAILLIVFVATTSPETGRHHIRFHGAGVRRRMSDERITAIAWVVVLGLFLAVEMWFFFVILKFYRYLRDTTVTTRTTATVATVQGTA